MSTKQQTQPSMTVILLSDRSAAQEVEGPALKIARKSSAGLQTGCGAGLQTRAFTASHFHYPDKLNLTCSMRTSE